jgi:hypothetical protein
VGGVELPFVQVITIFGPEQAPSPLESYFHKVEISRAAWDAVPAAALTPDPALPTPADVKPVP